MYNCGSWCKNANNLLWNIVTAAVTFYQMDTAAALLQRLRQNHDKVPATGSLYFQGKKIGMEETLINSGVVAESELELRADTEANCLTI
jgi:hypothetical protein